MRFEIARLFGVLPIALLPLPVGEYRKMRRYYVKYREAMDHAGDTSEPDGMIIE